MLDIMRGPLPWKWGRNLQQSVDLERSLIELNGFGVHPYVVAQRGLLHTLRGDYEVARCLFSRAIIALTFIPEPQRSGVYGQIVESIIYFHLIERDLAAGDLDPKHFSIPSKIVLPKDADSAEHPEVRFLNEHVRVFILALVNLHLGNTDKALQSFRSLKTNLLDNSGPECAAIDLCIAAALYNLGHKKKALESLVHVGRLVFQGGKRLGGALTAVNLAAFYEFVGNLGESNRLRAFLKGGIDLPLPTLRAFFARIDRLTLRCRESNMLLPA